MNILIAFLFPFGGLTSSSGSLSDNADRVPGEVDRLGNTWELERDCGNTEVSEGPADTFILALSTCCASAARQASSSTAFRASAALCASAAALWDVRTGVDVLLGSVTLAVAIMERLGLDPDGSWPLLSILAAPESAKLYESMKCIVERKKNRTWTTKKWWSQIQMGQITCSKACHSLVTS